METKTIIYIVIAAFLLIMNLNSFRLMAKDKRRAQKDTTHSHPETRVPEKTLFLATALFGGHSCIKSCGIISRQFQFYSFQ